MKEFQDAINQQFEYSRGKNLFYDGIINSLRFSPETLKAIENLELNDVNSENLLIDYLTNRALQEFSAVNQYYSFDNRVKKSLRDLYVNLFARIKNHESSIDLIASEHYQNILKWLLETNPFAEQIYSSKGIQVEPVACSEYSSKLQIQILQIDIEHLIEPVLDIGCGREGNLVKYLRLIGIEAYGFDRYAFDDSYLSNNDWFDYKFEKGKWGTITSNLGFSNHFQHHHLRDDGNFIGYAQKYMEILSSLKLGGCFHYAPDLSFIEKYLDRNSYQLIKQHVGNYDFKSVKVKRIK